MRRIVRRVFIQDRIPPQLMTKGGSLGRGRLVEKSGACQVKLESRPSKLDRYCRGSYGASNTDVTPSRVRRQSFRHYVAFK